MLVVALNPLILIIVDKLVGTGQIFRKMGDLPVEKQEKRVNFIIMGNFYLLIAYSIFLPLKPGTTWFQAGVAVWSIGAFIFLTAIVNAATTPAGQVFKKGMYRFSRHPLYISLSLVLLGAGLASASWLFLLLTVVYTICQNSQVSSEERDCLKVFGDEYKAYMKKTPRWWGLPRSRTSSREKL